MLLLPSAVCLHSDKINCLLLFFQREEKRLQRQKEIEAKRAARRGPMKLGAKKPSNDLF